MGGFLKLLRFCLLTGQPLTSFFQFDSHVDWDRLIVLTAWSYVRLEVVVRRRIIIWIIVHTSEKKRVGRKGLLVDGCTAVSQYWFCQQYVVVVVVARSDGRSRTTPQACRSSSVRSIVPTCPDNIVLVVPSAKQPWSIQTVLLSSRAIPRADFSLLTPACCNKAALFIKDLSSLYNSADRYQTNKIINERQKNSMGKEKQKIYRNYEQPLAVVRFLLQPQLSGTLCLLSPSIATFRQRLRHSYSNSYFRTSSSDIAMLGLLWTS